MANEIERRNEAFLIYQDENGIARVNVRFEGEDVCRSWDGSLIRFDYTSEENSPLLNC